MKNLFNSSNTPVITVVDTKTDPDCVNLVPVKIRPQKHDDIFGHLKWTLYFEAIKEQAKMAEEKIMPIHLRQKKNVQLCIN